MTRKHFEAIAETIRNSNIGDDATAQIAYDLANTLERFNPNFDKHRFLKACGVVQ